MTKLDQMVETWIKAEDKAVQGNQLADAYGRSVAKLNAARTWEHIDMYLYEVAGTWECQDPETSIRV